MLQERFSRSKRAIRSVRRLPLSLSGVKDISEAAILSALSRTAPPPSTLLKGW